MVISGKCQPHFGQGLPFNVASIIESASRSPSCPSLGPVCLGSLLQTVFTAIKLPTLPLVLIFSGSVCFFIAKTYGSWMPFSWGKVSSMQLAFLAISNMGQEIYNIPKSSQAIGMSLAPYKQQPENAVFPPPGSRALGWRSPGAQMFIHV